MQTLNINTPSKSTKKKSGQQRNARDVGSGNTVKRKSSESQQQAPISPCKKTKPETQPEVFDSYKFSLELINGEMNVPKETTSKDSKKYVLFIGNLPYDITREQLEEHFRKTGEFKEPKSKKKKNAQRALDFKCWFVIMVILEMVDRRQIFLSCNHFKFYYFFIMK